MNNIKALIKKDLLNLASYKVSIIILFVGVCLCTLNTNVANLAPIVIITMVGMISLSTFSYDEISKAEKYLLAMPNTKEDMIKAKYILVIGLTVLGGVVAYFLTILLSYVMNKVNQNAAVTIDYMSLLYTTIAGIFGIGLVESIQIPSIYKWGAEKGRVQMFILVFIIFLIIGVVAYFITKFGLDIDITSAIDKIKDYAVYILLVITAILYYISYKVAYKIYKKKEY